MPTISIPLYEAADIETYDGLVAFLIAHLELDAETEAQLPALIRMAEYRLNRMLMVPERETSVSLTTVADVQFAALPVGFRQLRTAYLDGEYPLAPVTLNVLYGQFGGDTGKPTVYTVQNQSLYFGPMPDAAYSVTITYMEKLPPISLVNQSNWLLAENADAYVYACLVQIEAFLGNDVRIPMIESALVTCMDEVNLQGNRYRKASPMRLRSPGVIV